MKKFEGVLFCTDLDGTLYADDKTVSAENLQAIDYFRSEGGLFTFITGRVPCISQDICAVVRPNVPYGCANGAAVYDPAVGRYLFSRFLPEQALELVRAVDAQLPDMGIQFNTENDVLFSKDNAAMERFRVLTGAPHKPCSREGFAAPLLKVIFAHTDERRLAEVMRLCEQHPAAEHVDFVHSEKTLYEIVPKGANKGAGLCKLAELLGVPLRRTVAVGDYHNDVPMLQQAGLSFAVQNAADAAKAAARYRTVSNNDHAIAAIIDGLDRGAYPMD